MGGPQPTGALCPVSLNTQGKEGWGRALDPTVRLATIHGAWVFPSGQWDESEDLRYTTAHRP